MAVCINRILGSIQSPGGSCKITTTMQSEMRDIHARKANDFAANNSDTMVSRI